MHRYQKTSSWLHIYTNSCLLYSIDDKIDEFYVLKYHDFKSNFNETIE